MSTPFDASIQFRFLSNFPFGVFFNDATRAWKLFTQWMDLGAVSKEKWAPGAIGHLGGDSSVLKLTPLIRNWPGESQHQRAVFGLECLRAIGSDTALMSLNGISLKLKFQALKEKAKALMQEIADSRGLSREQLADRIVPDCDLDETGSRIFDFGPRQFRFVLGGEMKPMVRDSAGIVKSDLPKPTKQDDPAKSEAAVADWKLLKKTLSEVLKVQAGRLESSMISGRRWNHEEFKSCFLDHPLMINLVRQLVWGIYDSSNKLTKTFRVTEDRSIADQNDDDLSAEIIETGRLGIVHTAHLSHEHRSAWGQVLSDYEIIPPFQQLGRTVVKPHEDDLEQTAISRYKAPPIPGLVLNGILERSQWVRGELGDHGDFNQHYRYYESAEVTAFICYSGMGAGYYEQPQHLEEIYFVQGITKSNRYSNHEKRLKIKDVDDVVISEVLRLVEVLVSKAE